MSSTTTPVVAPFTTSPTVISSPMVNPAPYCGSTEDSNVFFFNASWPWRCSCIDFQRNAPKCPLLFFIQPIIQPISEKSLVNLLVIPPWASNLLMIMLAAASGRNERSLLTTYRQGLEPNLRLQLAAHDDGIGLEKFRVTHRVQGCMKH